jgi:hypothetical protein
MNDKAATLMDAKLKMPLQIGWHLMGRFGSKPKQVWSIRPTLQREDRIRDLALFDLTIDSKLRGCDLFLLCHKTLVRFYGIACGMRLMIHEANRGTFICHTRKRITPRHLCRGADPRAWAR